MRSTKGGGRDEARFELRHIRASTFDDGDIMTPLDAWLRHVYHP